MLLKQFSHTMSSSPQKPIVMAGISTGAPIMQEARVSDTFDKPPMRSNEADSPVCITQQEASEILSNESRAASLLPPVDGGRQAWAYLLCATILETLVWGEWRLTTSPAQLLM